MSRIGIFLLDESNNIKEEINIIKPETYIDLLTHLDKKYKNLSEYYELFIISQNKKKIIINNEEAFSKIDDIIFIRNIDPNKINQSFISKNYNILPQTKIEQYEEKYNCILCSVIINNENPYLCYKCQKIFHEQCLKEWNEKCKLQNKILFCPNCRNKLSIEKWNKKLDHIDNLKDNEDLIKNLYECKLRNIMNNNLIIIKDKKINELKQYKKKQSKLIQKYENYIEKSIHIFKNILIQLNSFHSLYNSKGKNNLDDVLDFYPSNFDNLYDSLSKVINEELAQLKTYLFDSNKFQNLMEVNDINFRLVNNDHKLNHDKNNENSPKKVQININQMKIKLNNHKTEEFRNRINLIYYAKSEKIHEIFGEEFVLNNTDNIDLIINGKSNKLVSNYELKQGENIVTMIIKNKLVNLSHMFSGCGSLKNIEELKYLNIMKVKDFSSMFWGCLLLSDIKSLQNWDVSNVKNFSYMFGGCSLLSDLTPLANWNVSNGNNFASMFWGCSALSDVKALQSWNVAKGKNFSSMFSECLSLSDISPLNKWRIAYNSDISNMFWECSSLNDKTPLINSDNSKLISTF